MALAAAVTFLAACATEPPVSQAIAAAVQRGPGTQLVLADLAPFPWDRVCIIGPYTGDARVDAVTGVNGAAAHAHGIGSSDGINVLMFVSEDRIATSVAQPRNLGDFGPEVTGTCYSREAARFVVRIPPSGSWGSIGME